MNPLDGRSLTASLALHALALAAVFLVLPALRDQTVVYEAVQVHIVSAPAPARPEPDAPPPAPEEELVVETPEDRMEEVEEEAPAPLPEPEPAEPEPEEPEPEEPAPEPEPRSDPPPDDPPPPTEDPAPADSEADEEPEDAGEDIAVRMEGLRRDHPAYHDNIIRQVERCFRSPAASNLEAVGPIRDPRGRPGVRNRPVPRFGKLRLRPGRGGSGGVRRTARTTRPPAGRLPVGPASGGVPVQPRRTRRRGPGGPTQRRGDAMLKMLPASAARAGAVRGRWHSRGIAPRRLALALAGLGAVASPLAAQEEAIPGVRLGLVYENLYIPPLAILPFTGSDADVALVREVQSIIARDLDFSDRFVILDSLPEGLADDGIRYSLWDQYGADWVLAGDVEEVGGRHFLSLELHDIVFARAQRGSFALPPRGSDGYRMAVHRVSDQVVEWVTGEPGAAASRIVFAMRPFGNPSAKELYVVDSDGENLERVTWDESIAISPTWSPDGNRLAYVSYKSGVPTIYEIDTRDGSERSFAIGREGQQQTPAYHPDGHEIAFNLVGAGLFRYQAGDDCCLAQVVGGRAANIQPSYSHDGEDLVFVSNRLGVSTPQVYVMSARGGDANLLSPYRFGQGGYFADPDWSPLAGRVAFAGGIARRRVYNQYQIFVAETEAGGQPADPADERGQQRGSELGARREAHRVRWRAAQRVRRLRRRFGDRTHADRRRKRGGVGHRLVAFARQPLIAGPQFPIS